MTTRTRYDLKALFLLVMLGGATAADAQVQPQLAQRYFEEVTKLCERDAGRLWGVSLCEERDRAQQVRVAELRRRFVDGPVLTMTAVGSGTSDSTDSVGIPGAGTVFRNLTLSAQWGRLTANGGVLRSADGTTLSVPVTGPLEGTALRGEGWSATLNSGWVVRPTARPGSSTIVREN